MPYCRKCGTRLDADARFCQKCGTPVLTYAPPPPPPRPYRRSPVTVVVIAVIAILIVVVVVAVVAFAPLSPFNFSSTNQDSHSGINTLNLNFQASNAQVNVLTENVTDKNILVWVYATGSKGILSPGKPIEVAFIKETANDVLTINSKVTQTAISNVKVTCNIYVNPALNLNLNVTSETGQVSLTADSAAKLQSVTLNSNTGEVQANLQNNVTVWGNVTLKTQTGNIFYRMDQANTIGNQTVALQSSTGSISPDITQTKVFGGNLLVNAQTSTGTINLGLQIDGYVGARIVSQTNLGTIRLQNVQSFSGNKSPIQSNNYPSTCNIDIINHTELGGINIDAAYLGSNGPVIKN